MNVLEIHIGEVFDVKEVNMEGGWQYILVNMMAECQGSHKIVQKRFDNMEDWVTAREKGYYTEKWGW